MFRRIGGVPLVISLLLEVELYRNLSVFWVKIGHPPNVLLVHWKFLIEKKFVQNSEIEENRILN